MPSSAHTSRPAWCPPTGGGMGTSQTAPRRVTAKAAGDGVTGVKLTTKPGGAHYGAVPSSDSIAQEKTAAYVIDNLKRQVNLLEADNQAMRAGAGSGSSAVLSFGGDSSAVVGVDDTIRKVRGDYERNEAAHGMREQELTMSAERLRKEALAAKLRERNAVDEMAEAKELLTEQREKFAAARQELTAEVIAYQRDLDELAHAKRQLQADLADAQGALREREEFMEGFDARVRLLATQVESKSDECVRAHRTADLVRAELQEERAQAAQLKDKYDSLRARQAHFEDMRGSFGEEATEAIAELRKVKIELEQERQARKLADDAKNYLVLEQVKLEAMIKELSSTAEFIHNENARLKQDAGNNKVMKVVGRFMVRKMRERLTEAKASEQVVRDNEAALNHRFVRSEQKCVAIERELMVLRRRQSERDAAYEQQRSDASDLSLENRMLLEEKEQMLTDAQRRVRQLEHAMGENVELKAELDVLNERLEVLSALGKFRPEDLLSVSQTNAMLAESIQALLPKLEKSSKGQRPFSSEGAPTRAAAPASSGYTDDSLSGLLQPQMA